MSEYAKRSGTAPEAENFMVGTFKEMSVSITESYPLSSVYLTYIPFNIRLFSFTTSFPLSSPEDVVFISAYGPFSPLEVSGFLVNFLST